MVKYNTDIDLIKKSINNLENYIIKNDWKGYEPFDGLSSYINKLTFDLSYLRILLLQSVKRFPFNVRPILGIDKQKSTKAMGYLARGYLNLYCSTYNESYKNKAAHCLDWLIKNKNNNYSGSCWGNHFDYQSRLFYLKKFEPTIVWTAIIANVFIDAYEIVGEMKYLKEAESTCYFIMNDLGRYEDQNGKCIDYIVGKRSSVHNANLLGASVLARVGVILHNEEFINEAKSSVDFSVGHQNRDFSWSYGILSYQNWVDNWHTGYNLDSLKYYIDYTNDSRYLKNLEGAFDYYINNFFEINGEPKYYNNKKYVIDIQCCSQAIDTLVKLSCHNTNAMDLALKVAKWSIINMQDNSGYFYYRKYRFFYNKTPTIHWGQATMFNALSLLLKNIIYA